MSFETSTLSLAAEKGSCVGRWLEGLGMGEYSGIFQKHEITMNDLPLLSAENLKELGFSKVIEAIRLSICLNHQLFNVQLHPTCMPTLTNALTHTCPHSHASLVLFRLETWSFTWSTFTCRSELSAIQVGPRNRLLDAIRRYASLT